MKKFQNLSVKSEVEAFEERLASNPKLARAYQRPRRFTSVVNGTRKSGFVHCGVGGPRKG